MPIYEFACSSCGTQRDALLRHEELQAIREQIGAGNFLVCPTCKSHDGSYRQVWTAAPMGRIGGSGSERDIAAMQKDCRERFVKSGEIDDVRHKHGAAFDDSIRGAAVERIKDAKRN